MMLVISTTILFLGFYISTASTTPLVTNSSLLAPRTIPADNLCSAADQWLRRECDPQEGMTLWRDICYRDTSNVDYIYSNCPNYFLCNDFVDARGDNSIKCVPINRPGNTSPRTTDGDPQIGTSYKISADGSGRDTELAFSVTIANDMSASATAVFLSNDRTFIVIPNNVIVGKIRGKEITVCQGSPECLPIANFDFKKGDIIDFTWGLLSGLQGTLSYTIWPST